MSNADPYDNQPLSEIYRNTAKKWVDYESAASLLEETKSSVLQTRAQEFISMYNISGAEAERRVKSTPEWREWIEAMCEARKKALLLKCQLEYIRMRFQERMSADATSRAEMKL